jgi:hypothetical protein
MADLKVLPHVIEAVLNHSSGTKAGPAGIYNRSTYAPQVTTARSYLSALYSWAMREGLCDSNPVINTNNPAAGLPSRDRVLSPSKSS